MGRRDLVYWQSAAIPALDSAFECCSEKEAHISDHGFSSGMADGGAKNGSALACGTLPFDRVLAQAGFELRGSWSRPGRQAGRDRNTDASDPVEARSVAR